MGPKRSIKERQTDSESPLPSAIRKPWFCSLERSGAATRYRQSSPTYWNAVHRQRETSSRTRARKALRNHHSTAENERRADRDHTAHAMVHRQAIVVPVLGGEPGRDLQTNGSRG